MIAEILKPFGAARMPFGSLLLTVIAVATVGYVAFRYLATGSAEGRIVEVRPYCELVTCWGGKCNSRVQMACHDIPAKLEQNQSVRRFQQGRVEFVGGDGMSRAAWAEFSRIGKTVKPGERVKIHYIDGFGEEPEITGPPSFFVTMVGIASFLFFLSIGARLNRSRWSSSH